MLFYQTPSVSLITQSYMQLERSGIRIFFKISAHYKSIKLSRRKSLSFPLVKHSALPYKLLYKSELLDMALNMVFSLEKGLMNNQNKVSR